MILKEAFRMQNYLAKMMDEAKSYLGKTSNITKMTKTHLRSKSNPNGVDETEEVKPEMDYDPGKVVDLYLDLISEREKLAIAIDKAKQEADIDMDAAIMSNKDKQIALTRMRLMDALKADETEVTGKDYLINNEGNQVPYNYKIKTVTEINYDRNVIKGIIKRLSRETDETSAKIDLLNVTLQVAYDPRFEIDSSFEDIYSEYTK